MEYEIVVSPPPKLIPVDEMSGPVRSQYPLPCKEMAVTRKLTSLVYGGPFKERTTGTLLSTIPLIALKKGV